MKPHFIGIGAQKCATAWLHSMLEDHPQISMAKTFEGKKDTEFFSYYYDRGFEWYERNFENKENRITGEYSTSYFCSYDAPERIYNYSPEMKLIVSLRHPVDRAFSNHKHEIKLGRISGVNLLFENALKNNPMYLYQSMYFTHMSRWLQFFDKKQIFIILVDELREKPEKILRDLYAFLSVDRDHKPVRLHQRIHETRVPQNSSLESLIKKTSVLLKSIGCARLIAYLKSKGVKKSIYNLNSQKGSFAFPPMQENTRLALLEYFKEENSKLSILVNRDLSAWDV
jgi:hypothetical protein